MGAAAAVSHAARNAGIAVLIVAVIGIAGGFVVSVPVTAKVPVTYLSTSQSYSTSVGYTSALSVSEQTSYVPYVTSSTYQTPVTEQVTTTQYGYSISSVTLQCNQYVHSGWSLNPGTNVQVSWSADNTVDIWVFTSSEYNSYVNGGTTSPNVYSWGGAPASGTLSFYVSGADTYYLVLHNPHNGIACLGSSPLAIYTVSGQAVFTEQVVTYVTQTQTYTATSQTVYTVTYTVPLTTTTVITQPLTFTLTSTSTTSCSYNFWNWLFGSKSCS